MSDKDFSKKIHIKSDTKLKSAIKTTSDSSVFRKANNLSQSHKGSALVDNIKSPHVSKLARGVKITKVNAHVAKALKGERVRIDKAYKNAKTINYYYLSNRHSLKKRLKKTSDIIGGVNTLSGNADIMGQEGEDTDQTAVNNTKSAFSRPTKKSIRLIRKGFDTKILQRNKFTNGKRSARFNQQRKAVIKKGLFSKSNKLSVVMDKTSAITSHIAKGVSSAVKAGIASLGTGYSAVIALALAVLIPVIVVVVIGGGFMNIINSSSDSDDSDTTVTNAPVSGESLKNALEIDKKLKSLGFSLQGRAGALGTFQNESNFMPDAYNKLGQVGGFGQWGIGGKNGSRIESNHVIKGNPPKNDTWTLSNEIKLMEYELNNGYKNVLELGKKATDSENFAETFVNDYEGAPGQDVKAGLYARAWEKSLSSSSSSSHSDSNILNVAKSYIGWFHYPDPIAHNVSMIGGSTKHPNKEGQTDCSGFIWLVLENAGYKVPSNMGWFTGTMASDARGSHQWLKSVDEKDAKAGDIVIVNKGGGAGANGHTAILAENWHGADTKIIQMGGAKSIVNEGTFGSSFSVLLSGGDVCLARAVK